MNKKVKLLFLPSSELKESVRNVARNVIKITPQPFFCLQGVNQQRQVTYANELRAH